MDESRESTGIDADTPNEGNEEESSEVLQEPASTREPEDEKSERDNVHIATAQIENESVVQAPIDDDFWGSVGSTSKKDKKKKKTPSYLVAEE